jgi:hypothetical protein
MRRRVCPISGSARIVAVASKGYNMRTKKAFVSLLAALMLSSVFAAGAAAAPPESERVYHLYEVAPVDCNGEQLTRVMEGWVNTRELPRQQTLFTYHLRNTYTNDSGETFVYLDVGSARIFDDGFVVAGHTGGWDGQDAYYGRRLFKDGVETVVGSNRGLVDDLACAALTN